MVNDPEDIKAIKKALRQIQFSLLVITVLVTAVLAAQITK